MAAEYLPSSRLPTHSTTSHSPSEGVPALGEVIVDHDDVLVVVLDVWVTFFDDQWAEQSTVELSPT